MNLLRSCPSPVAILLVFASSFCFAQTRIPPDIIVLERPLTRDEKNAVDSYVSYWCDKLNTGSEDEISLARVKLLDHFSLIAKYNFKEYYADRVAEQLAQAMTSSRVMTRINALIVAEHLPDTVCSEMLAMGMNALKDSNPAVRYWAGKLLSHAAMSCSFNDGDLKKLINAFQNAIRNESSETVVEQLHIALASVNTEDAFNLLIDLLNNRLKQHSDQPGESVSTELGAMTQLQTLLITASQSNEPFVDRINRRFAKLVLHYEYMLAETLQNRNTGMTEATTEEYKVMIKLCDDFLTYYTRPMISKQALPDKSITSLLQSESWNGIMMRVREEWAGILKNPPFSFPDNELVPN